MHTEYCCILNPWVNLAVLAPSDISNILNSLENQHPIILWAHLAVQDSGLVGCIFLWALLQLRKFSQFFGSGSALLTDSIQGLGCYHKIHGAFKPCPLHADPGNPCLDPEDSGPLWDKQKFQHFYLKWNLMQSHIKTVINKTPLDLSSSVMPAAWATSCTMTCGRAQGFTRDMNRCMES